MLYRNAFKCNCVLIILGRSIDCTGVAACAALSVVIKMVAEHRGGPQTLLRVIFITFGEAGNVLGCSLELTDSFPADLMRI